MEEAQGLHIEHKPEISVYPNQGGEITIRILQMDVAKERVDEGIISIPIEYAVQVGQALIDLAQG